MKMKQSARTSRIFLIYAKAFETVAVVAVNPTRSGVRSPSILATFSGVALRRFASRMRGENPAFSAALARYMRLSGGVLMPRPRVKIDESKGLTKTMLVTPFSPTEVFFEPRSFSPFSHHLSLFAKFLAQFIPHRYSCIVNYNYMNSVKN